MILTLNEEANIGRTLAKLTWARRILVIDSGSTDRTLEIIRQHPQVVVLRRDFDSAAAQ
jgi:glycosyltransferase involved in cell wall biosynthesis